MVQKIHNRVKMQVVGTQVDCLLSKMFSFQLYFKLPGVKISCHSSRLLSLIVKCT